MEQKDYKFEIINELLKNKVHVRELAKKLNINHMTVSRKIKEIFKLNIIDYDKIGKNKIYFLKKSPESKSIVFMTENYKLIQLLKKYPSLNRIITKIQTNKKINLAVVFGSYAKNNPKKDSDIDIYIETNNRKIKEDLSVLDSKLSIKIGKYDKNNLLIKEIEKNHIIIKGVEIFYEKNKFFD